MQHQLVKRLKIAKVEYKKTLNGIYNTAASVRCGEDSISPLTPWPHPLPLLLLSRLLLIVLHKCASPPQLPLLASCISHVAATFSLTPMPPTWSITETALRLEIGILSSGKAAGPDGLCPRLLKDCVAQLCQLLHMIFNSSI